jgi:hypothetical protein
MTYLAQYRENTGIGSQVIQIVPINALNPAAITFGRPGVPNTHGGRHGSKLPAKTTRPG